MADYTEYEDHLAYANKPKYVYLFCLLVGTDKYYKIGFSNNISSRLTALRAGSPFELSLIHTIKTQSPHDLEYQLHLIYSAKRVKNEWFLLSDTDVKEICAMKGIE